MKQLINYFATCTAILLALTTNLQAQQSANTESAVSDKQHRISIREILFSGVLIKQEEKKRVFYVPNAFEWFPANTVEGFVVNPQVKFTQNLDSGRFYSITPNLRYGFGNDRFQAQVKSQLYYNPAKHGLLTVSGGRGIEQLYSESTLGVFNTINTFAFSENFLKIYERSYLEIGQAISPSNNFWLQTTVSWNERNPLNNLPEFEEDEEFTSNNPENIEISNTAFDQHQAFIVEARLRWQIGHELVKKRGKLVSVGKYPSVTLAYTQAVEGVLGGDVSYQQLALSVEDKFRAGKTSGNWLVEAGDFLSNDSLTFVDFKHFKGEQTIYGSFDTDQFHLLDYYANSTAQFYLQAHYEHHFQALVNHKKFKFKPLLGAHYLYTDAGGHYVELGAGFDKVLGNWRVDCYNSWRDGTYESTEVRIGFSFE